MLPSAQAGGASCEMLQPLRLLEAYTVALPLVHSTITSEEMVLLAAVDAVELQLKQPYHSAPSKTVAVVVVVYPILVGVIFLWRMATQPPVSFIITRISGLAITPMWLRLRT